VTRRAAAAIVLALAAGCGARPAKSEAERTITDAARGVRYIAPEGWKSFDGEVRSPEGSLLTVRVYDLVEADKKFVAGLPDTLVPQLTEWAKYYFIVEGAYTEEPTTVAGLPATEFNYSVRIRRQDPPSKVTYWVVKREQRLFVLRAAYAPQGLVTDEPTIREVVAHWSFLETPEKGE